MAPEAERQRPGARRASLSASLLDEERQIALLRLPFALPPLLVVVHYLGADGPLPPVAHLHLAGAAAAGYALYALLAVLLAEAAGSGPSALRRRTALDWLCRWQRTARPAAVAIDLAFATLLLYAVGAPTDSGPSTFPPVLLCLHAVFASALRWGPSGAAVAALLGAGMGGLVLWNTPAAGQIGYIGLFLLLGALLGIRLCGIVGGRGRRALAAERDRIARDLHDDFIQNLVAAGLRVDLCRSLLAEARGENLEPLAAELEELQRLLNGSLKQSRAYLTSMHPCHPRSGGLAACLEQCARELFRGQAVETSVSVSPPAPELAPEVETAAYYIAREALFNARKHAAPRQVVVSLECRHDRVRVIISDDGRGLPSKPTETEGHRGLRTMRERAESLGGSLRLVSAPGRGTRVIALLPVVP